MTTETIDVQLVAITMADGSLQIMHFVKSDGRNVNRLATFDNVVDEIRRTGFDVNLLPIKGWHFIEREDVPEERQYRNAWVSDGKTIVHDMAKARNIHRDILRKHRDRPLAKLDVEYMRADEQADEVQKLAIRAQKQKLRDAPAHASIEAAQTTDELRAITLEGLTA